MSRKVLHWFIWYPYQENQDLHKLKEAHGYLQPCIFPCALHRSILAIFEQTDPWHAWHLLIKLSGCKEIFTDDAKDIYIARSGGDLGKWYLRYINGVVVILTPKFRSDCKISAFLFFGSEKKVGGASDLSRGGFRPPPPLADNPVTCMYYQASRKLFELRRTFGVFRRTFDWI